MRSHNVVVRQWGRVPLYYTQSVHAIASPKIVCPLLDQPFVGGKLEYSRHAPRSAGDA